MKDVCILLVAGLLLSGCSYDQYGAVTSGSGIGGMFGSAIGGILGGRHGSDAGAVIGMVAGGAAGAAISTAAEKGKTRRGHKVQPEADVGYASGDVSFSQMPPKNTRYEDLRYLLVERVHFSDADGNRTLDAGEEAYISFEIYNQGELLLHDVVPHVTCDSRQVQLSPPAIISTIAPGQGVRYKTALRAGRRLKPGSARFTIVFGDGHNAVTAKSFTIDTRR